VVVLGASVVVAVATVVEVVATAAVVDDGVTTGSEPVVEVALLDEQAATPRAITMVKARERTSAPDCEADAILIDIPRYDRRRERPPLVQRA